MSSPLSVVERTHRRSLLALAERSVAAHPTRTFNRFSDAAAEVVVARIYEGIHFRFADVEARQQGQCVAGWAFKRFLRPVGDDDHDDGDHHGGDHGDADRRDGAHHDDHDDDDDHCGS